MEQIELVDPRTGESFIIDAPTGFEIPTDPDRARQFFEAVLAAKDAQDVAATADEQVVAAETGPTLPTAEWNDRETQFGDVLDAWRDAYPDFDVSNVPEGQGMQLGGGFVWYPNENIWYQANPDEVDPMISVEAARRRMVQQQEDGTLGRVLSSPEYMGALDGATFGLFGNALNALDPIAGEHYRQTQRENREESPWRTLAGEIPGMVATSVAAAGTKAGAAAGNWVASQPLWAQMGLGAVTGAAGNAAYEAAIAEPGDRVERATDPLTLGIGAVAGGLAPAVIPAIGRGFNAARDWYRGAADEVPLGLPAPSANELAGTTVTPDAAPNQGVPVYGVPATSADTAVPGYDPAVAAANAENYLRGITPPTALDGQIATLDAGNQLGLPVPRGVVNPPEGINEALNRPTLWASGKATEALDELRTGLANRFGRTVTELGQNVSNSLGVAGDRIRAAATRAVDGRIADLRGQYDEFNAQFQGNFELPTILNDELEGIFQRRFEAGAMEGDARMLTDVRNLIARNTVGEDEAADAVEGVTWQGLRDARSLLTTRINNMERSGRVLTPYERDMESMKDSLTAAMTEIVRKNAPEGEADAAVARFLDLDQQYAVANQTRHDMNRLLGDESVTVMDEIRGALSRGGKTSIDMLKNLKANAGQTEWGNAMAVMLHNLGAKADGSFDPAKFASDWRKMAPDAVDEMFSKAHKADLDAIAVIGGRLSNIAKEGVGSRTMADIGKFALTGASGMNPISMVVWGNHVEQMFKARNLSNPYTTNQAARLYRLADQVRKSTTDAERALRTQRLWSKTKNAARAVGYTGLAGMTYMFGGSGRSGASDERNVVGGVRN